MSNADQVDVFLRLLLALGLGAAVGLEREYRGHEAGIRTSAIVCLGAAAFGEISNSFGDSRVAAGVVQGIGFIGGGLIFQRGLDVVGVTTAAMVWALAAVGLLVANELWLVAVLISATMVVLLELAPVSEWVYAHRRPTGPDAEDEQEREARRGHQP